jgi:hypothetical protein
MMACFRVRTFEPTAVPSELAASFAPIDHPTARPMRIVNTILANIANDYMYNH